MIGMFGFGAGASFGEDHTLMASERCKVCGGCRQPKIAAEDPKFYKLLGFGRLPKITQVIFNGDATIVKFVDGTKSVVRRHGNDAADRTTAVVYALLKRVLATTANMKTDEVNAAYINSIAHLIDGAYDQEKEEAAKAEREKKAKAEHDARQKKLQEKAFKRRVKNRVKDLQVEEAARNVLAGKGTTAEPAKMITETTAPAREPTSAPESKSSWIEYQRPNKPFSQFTDEEKREYWRAQNSKRRAGK